MHSALRRGVRVYGLSRYRVGAPGPANLPPALVLGWGNVEEQILRGMAVLGEILSDTLV